MKSAMTRRHLLRYLGIGSAGIALAACQPKVVEKIVEKTVVVEKEVEKVVEKPVEKVVEKVVQQTVVVEKQVAAKPVLADQTLRFGYGGWAQSFADVCISNFNAKFPNVKVELEVIAGDLIQQLYTQAAAGTTGDVQWIADAHVLALVSNKVMLDMTPFAEKENPDPTKDMWPGMYGLGKIGDGWYMIAWAADGLVMYYNKTLFDAAGVTLPDPLKGWTVQEFQEATAKVTNEKDQVYGTMISEAWWAVYVPLIEAYGGTFYSEDKNKVLIDSPEAMEACQALADLYVKYKSHVPRGANFGGDAFILGKAATDFTNRYKCKNIRDAKVKFDWDVSLVLTGSKKKVGGSGSMGPGVTAAAMKRGTADAAWKLASTIISPEVQRFYSHQYMAVPVLQSMKNDPTWLELPPPPANNQCFSKLFDYAILPPVPKNNDCGSVYVGETNKIMTDAWDQMCVGGKPATEVLPAAAKAINDCIARGGK